jgi:hypothetical protein
MGLVIGPFLNSDFQAINLTVFNDMPGSRRGEMAADHEYRFAAESLQKMFTGMQRHFGIEIEWTAPVWMSHLAGMMDQIAGYDSVFTL